VSSNNWVDICAVGATKGDLSIKMINRFFFKLQKHC
jgi:hypothetical protein